MAAQVTLASYTLMRAVALDFPHDRAAHDITDQFLFGPALLVCPVTQPMYYSTDSQPISGAKHSRAVYLPVGSLWFGFWTDLIFEGGQEITADAPLQTIPLFIRAGSILPMTRVMQYTNEVLDAPYEIRVYTGVDAQFTLYEDAGDTYDYEEGAFALVHMSWVQESGELTISAREGAFPELVKERDYCIVLISEMAREVTPVHYTGHKVVIRRASSHLH